MLSQVDDYLGEGDEIEVRGNSDQGEKIALALENTPNSRRRSFESQLQGDLEEAEQSRQDYNAWARQKLGDSHHSTFP